MRPPFRSRIAVLAVVTAIILFVVLAYLSWQTKFGPAKTVGAVASIDTVVLHQRVVGPSMRGPTALDRLVAIDGRTGVERARTTVLRGELARVMNGNVVYAIGARRVLYDARTLEASPTNGVVDLPAPTRFGAMVDLGDALLMLDTMPGSEDARASRLAKESRAIDWSVALPWKGHDTKLVVQLGPNVVIVDADGAVGLDRMRGARAWQHP